MNAVKLIETHSELSEKIMDQEQCEPLLDTDLPAETAGKIHERAAHLRAIMEATGYYVEVILADTLRDIPNGDGLKIKLAATVIVAKQVVDDVYAAMTALGRLTDRTVEPPKMPKTCGFSEALQRLEACTTAYSRRS